MKAASIPANIYFSTTLLKKLLEGSDGQCMELYGWRHFNVPTFVVTNGVQDEVKQHDEAEIKQVCEDINNTYRVDVKGVESFEYGYVGKYSRTSGFVLGGLISIDISQSQWILFTPYENEQSGYYNMSDMKADHNPLLSSVLFYCNNTKLIELNFENLKKGMTKSQKKTFELDTILSYYFYGRYIICAIITWVLSKMVPLLGTLLGHTMIYKQLLFDQQTYHNCYQFLSSRNFSKFPRHPIHPHHLHLQHSQMRSQMQHHIFVHLFVIISVCTAVFWFGCGHLSPLTLFSCQMQGNDSDHYFCGYWNYIMKQDAFYHQRIKQDIHWLMGIPAGLKLNHALNQLLGNISLIVLDTWHEHIIARCIFSPYVITLLNSILFFGTIFCGPGHTFALILDVFHVFCAPCHILAKLFCFCYVIETKSLYTFGKVLRGQKYNQLKKRLDHQTFDSGQLLLGVVMFTILTFLLPTIIVYFIYFSIVILSIYTLHIGWNVLAICGVRHFHVLLWLNLAFFSTTAKCPICDGIFLEYPYSTPVLGVLWKELKWKQQSFKYKFQDIIANVKHDVTIFHIQYMKALKISHW
ncbi:hypothetical protein RFI_01664 [Reticulomyxa filosa]|uniref:Phosphatidylinositol N-acetylglucosaminyltransferase subunit Q n=1 Tax=Reticulomyxa filosa TaxID=46433 RepID=X6PBB6_RETFI|nr:hypothetical protein RFI_01664 [Reticulomyxa filosa]|eukprot:ETO35398.1 hypothetical protein RFI_01664 [Reticulomyxa filosa]